VVEGLVPRDHMAHVTCHTTHDLDEACLYAAFR
jgi:hypothetical protein